MEIEEAGRQMAHKPRREVCHGYQNTCQCSSCKSLAVEMQRGFTEDGEIKPKQQAKRQPWEVAA